MDRMKSKMFLYILLLLLCVSIIACSKKEEQVADSNVPSSITKVPSSDTNQQGTIQQNENNNNTTITPVPTDNNSLPVFEGSKITNKTTQLGNTPGNHANGGLICESDGWLYYCDYNNEGYLCKKKLDGSKKQILVEEKCININIINSYIYYHSQEDKYCLKRCTLKGKDITSLTDEWIMDYVVTSDNIYIATEYIERMDLDGNNRIQLTAKGEYNNLNIYGDYIFYTDYSKVNIYTVKNDGSEQYLVKENARVNVLYDENLYYIDETTHYLAELNIPTGEIKQIDYGFLPNMLDGILYINGGSSILKYEEEQNITVKYFALKREQDKEMGIDRFYIANGVLYILYLPDSNNLDEKKLATVNIETGELNLFE